MNDILAAIIPNALNIMVFLPLIYGIYLKCSNKLTTKKLCQLILVSGFILRLAYISYTNVMTRQHDLGRFDDNGESHANYMLYLLDNKHLPDFDPRGHWQFYHPPLHHLICAFVLGIVKAVGADYIKIGPNVLQFVTVCYSTLLCVVSCKMMKRIGIDGKALALSTAVVTFHPTLIILSGSINNDILSSLFAMLAVYFTVRWVQSRKIADILCIALSVGLGMMTKLTVGLLAPAIAAAFLTVLIKQRKEWLRLIPQFAAFGVVCVPLGLFWPVRNLVKFGVPMNYVPALDENSGQYIAVPALKRLTDFSVYQFASPFTQWEWNGAPYNEFNPVIALMKNAMFDEQTFFPKSITLQSLCTALFFAGAVTAVISFAAILLLWSKKEKQPLEIKLLIFLTFGVIFGNYIIFCINYPQVCTENMRYCVPLIFCGAAAIGLMLERFGKDDIKGSAAGYITKATSISMTAMCAFSIMVYTIMIYYNMAA